MWIPLATILVAVCASLVSVAAVQRVSSSQVNSVHSGFRAAKLDARYGKYGHHFSDHKVFDPVMDQHKGLRILNSLVMKTFLEPTFLTTITTNSGTHRTGKRRSFANLSSAMGRMVRGLTNLTVNIGRTINSENVNGSLSRLITSRLVGVSESLMGWVERSVDDLPSIPRLDAQECMKRCICEAHNQPKKYGAVGLVIQLFFPPYLDSEDASKVVSKYQLAARYGRAENANCAAQYDGCMVNVLDVLQGAINMVF